MKTIKAIVAFAAAAFISVSAQAQLAGTSSPPCWPSPAGTGTKLKTGGDQSGSWGWWYCSDKFRYDPVFYAGPKGAADRFNFPGLVSKLDMSDSSAQVLGVAWNAFVNRSPIDEGVRKFVASGLRDVFGNHKVAVNKPSNARPTYPVHGGRRAAYSNGTALVGSKCDCVKYRIVDQYEYCAVDGSDVLQISVTVCEPTLD